MFPISYRDLELMLMDRGALSNGSWRVDEAYVKVKGRWIYLYRAVDSGGQTIDFLLSAKRDAEAAKRFFPQDSDAAPHGEPRALSPWTTMQPIQRPSR
jgi:IS6 family transposase